MLFIVITNEQLGKIYKKTQKIKNLFHQFVIERN